MTLPTAYSDAEWDALPEPTRAAFAGLPVARPLTISAFCADEIGAHVFRHQVAEQLGADWPQRARGLVSCGEAGAVLVCADCDCSHIVPYRCAARSCPSCAHIASAVVVERCASRSEIALETINAPEAWDGPGPRQKKGWKLLTCTQRAEAAWGDAARFHPRRLREKIMRIRRAWGPFWRSVPWGKPVRYSRPDGKRAQRARRDTMFAMGIEVAPGGMVHLHAAVFGEFLGALYLRDMWRKQLGPAANIQIKAMRGASPDDFRKSLHEVLKYVSKGDSAGERGASRAASIELAMRSVRRVEMGGALRRVGATVTNADLVYDGAKNCLGCGVVGRWHWAGVRAPGRVVENGGFGLDRWDAVRDMPASERPEMYRAHFGGDPPPWMYESSEDLEFAYIT